MDKGSEVGDEMSEIGGSFVLELVKRGVEEPRMVRKDKVLEVVQGLELSDGLTAGCIILGLTIFAMAVLVAEFPEVEPLSEDGGDDGCDPCVAILLVGGFRS